MTDNSFISPMSMIKIDGAKIKLLREQQGLTQLYLATAVEVTTDTISRWENRRYPSIKRDNGLKLAEALNVELEDLLEDLPDGSPGFDTFHEKNSPSTKTPEIQQKRHSRYWPIYLLSGTLICVVLALTWYFFHPQVSMQLLAERIAPPHCISGQPFPVIIRVSGTPETATALIVKETLGDNGTVLSTSPKSAGGSKKHQIKWLNKDLNIFKYVYLASASGKIDDFLQFNGSAAISGETESSIIGKNSIIIGRHHWADTNKDNIISDDEILTVYDQYSGISDIDLNIDLIEELWMGSEYLWDSARAAFKIID